MKHLDETDSALGLPVFFDAVGRRWRRVRLCWSALVVLVTVLSATFVMSVFVNPVLPRLGLKPISALPHAVDIKPQPPPLPAASGRAQTARRALVALRRALATTHAVPSKRPSQMSVAPPPPATPPALPTGDARSSRRLGARSSVEASLRERPTSRRNPERDAFGLRRFFRL